jgi:hypothetical protein
VFSRVVKVRLCGIDKQRAVTKLGWFAYVDQSLGGLLLGGFSDPALAKAGATFRLRIAGVIYAAFLDEFPPRGPMA